MILFTTEKCPDVAIALTLTGQNPGSLAIDPLPNFAGRDDIMR
jgi:hypothetical protein